MKKAIFSTALILFFSSCYQLKPTFRGSFIDQRDGHEYKCVKLANQIWMAENLSFASPNSWFYNDDTIDSKRYGRYYLINAALNACPTNWHLPSDEEWQQLEVAAGMSRVDAEHDRFRGDISSDFWTNGTTDFGVIFAGIRKQNFYADQGQQEEFWTSTNKNMPTYTRLFKKGDDRICKNLLGAAYGCNVRCLKNDTTSNDIKIIKK